MIRDLDQVSAALPEVDVAIVGSGPAGMTLARELAGAGLSIMVLESGLRRVTARGDALRATEHEGIAIKEYSRERVLGGSSSTWAGLSSPMDAIDLVPRPWLQSSGWPLARDELLPLWQAAAERYRFAPLSRYEPGGFDEVKASGAPPPRWDELEEKVFLAADPPQDFGAEHADVFERPGVELLLDATLLSLSSDGAADAVRSARLVTRSGQQHELRARVFVLAAGGIENTRLLLLSTDGCAAGLGNERDQVGRWFMNHPKNYHGVITLAEPVRELPWHFGCMAGGHAGYAGLRLSDEAQARDGLLNSYVRFEPLFPWSDSEGVEAFVLMAKKSGALLSAFKRRNKGKVTSLRDYSETGDDSELQNARKTAWQRLGLVGRVLLEAPSVARYVHSRLREGRAPLVNRVRLRNFMEMEPQPEQRVVLGQAKDLNGSPLPRVMHAPSERDRRSMAAVHEALARELQRNGFGRLDGALRPDASPWPIDQDASHHMGATRMGADPATSVVNADLRLHETDNVYLAGASVFPTSGCANPTFTLVALSIRLAAHLKARLGVPSGAGATPASASPSAASSLHTSSPDTSAQAAPNPTAASPEEPS